MHKTIGFAIAAVLLLGCSRTSSGPELQLAMADELDACASLLVGDGEAGRGEEMAGHAARLRESQA